jgi:hypothetical protein
MTVCYFCHKSLKDSDYALFKDKRGKERLVHPTCSIKLKKLQEKHRKEEEERRKQRNLGVYFLESG